jgi:hypothetical protein
MPAPIIAAAATRAAAGTAARSSAARTASTGVNPATQSNRPIGFTRPIPRPQRDDSNETNFQDDIRNYRNQSTRRIKRVAIQQFKANAQEFFGDEIDVEQAFDEINQVDHLKEIAEMEVNEPSFPVRMFQVALFLDLVDIADFTGVGWVVMLFVKIIFTVILWFWLLGKISGLFKFGSKQGVKIIIRRMTKKAVTSFASKRLFAVFLINLIPIVGILASNAWFVFIAHNRMKKWAQTYIRLVESVGSQLQKIEKEKRRVMRETS